MSWTKESHGRHQWCGVGTLFLVQWNLGRLTGLKEEHGQPSQILFVEPMADFRRPPELWWKEANNPRIEGHRETPGFSCLWFLCLVLINIVSKTWSSCPDDELRINGWCRPRLFSSVFLLLLYSLRTKPRYQTAAASPCLTESTECQQFWKQQQAGLRGNLQSIVG